MRFGPVPLAEAEGAILAHAMAIAGHPLKKGHVLGAGDLAVLRAAGIETVIAARLEPGDVAEDQAAARAASGLARHGITAGAAFTGRVNLHAEVSGLLLVERDTVDRLNALDESVTLATLPPFAAVRAGQMVATLKIIPLAAPESVVAAWESISPPLALAPFRPCAAGLVQTELPSLKPSVLDKTARVTADRLAAYGSRLVIERRVPHRAEAVARAIGEVIAAGAGLVLVAGASAIIDRRDVVPEGIGLAGGEILQFGMPVDPGNLLLLGRIGATMVLGLPGCARSPKPNGVDWVLERLLAGQMIGPLEFAALGVGGLLGESPSRGLLREPARTTGAPRVAALVLAAGRSSRMGTNKLLIEIDGMALISRAVEAALAARAASVTVVVGHDAPAIRARLAGLPVAIVENPSYATGLSSSLRAGLAALPADMDGVLVCLADMPAIGAPLLDRMIDAFDPLQGREIVVPMRQGRRGNPVLWGRRFWPELARLTGDAGARHLIGADPEYLVELDCDDDAVLTDLDTPEAVTAYRAARASVD